jgi:hypothetical protein
MAARFTMGGGGEGSGHCLIPAQWPARCAPGSDRSPRWLPHPAAAAVDVAVVAAVAVALAAAAVVVVPTHTWPGRASAF